MQVARLLEELRRADLPAYLGTATPSGFEGAKKHLEKTNTEYVAIELRSEDQGATQVFILASAPFASGDAFAATARGKGAKNSRKLTSQQAVEWLGSIAKTARAERHRVTVSKKWGHLVIELNSEKG